MAIWKRDLNLAASDFCLSPLLTGTGSLALPYPKLQEGKHRRQTHQYFGEVRQRHFSAFLKTTVINLIAQGFIAPVSAVLDAVSAATSGNAGTVGEENSITSPA